MNGRGSEGVSGALYLIFLLYSSLVEGLYLIEIYVAIGKFHHLEHTKLFDANTVIVKT